MQMGCALVVPRRPDGWSGRSHDSGFDAAGRLAGRLVAGTACGAACSSSRSWSATGRQDPCSTWRARATAEYSRPDRTVSQGRWQKHTRRRRPADRPRVRPSLGASLLDVPEQHGKDPSRSRSGGLPWAHRSGGRTCRGALRRAPCYRGVSRGDAPLCIWRAPPHRSLPGVRFGAVWISRRPARSAASADIFRGGLPIQRSRPSRRFSGTTLLATAREQRSMSSGAHIHSITDHHLHADPS